MNQERLGDLLRSISTALDAEGIPYAVVGAFARNAWARPRATTDLDFAVGVDEQTLPRLLDLADRVGLRVRRIRSDAGDTVPDLVLLCAQDDPLIRVDFLVARTPFEESALARRRVAEHEGTRYQVISPEDVVVYKVVAGRPRDYADVDEVVRTRALAGSPVDWDYIERWAIDFGVEERVARLRAELENI